MILIAEIVIIIGNLVIKKIVNKIPLLLSGLNVVTIIIPLFINIVVMAICADQLYNDKRMIVDNVWSIITIIVVCIVVFMGTVCEKGGAIFFSAHVLEVAQNLCNRVSMIQNGRIILSGNMEELVRDQSLEELFMEKID